MLHGNYSLRIIMSNGVAVLMTRMYYIQRRIFRIATGTTLLQLRREQAPYCMWTVHKWILERILLLVRVPRSFILVISKQRATISQGLSMKYEYQILCAPQNGFWLNTTIRAARVHFIDSGTKSRAAPAW